jgi:hypothetical protein
MKRIFTLLASVLLVGSAFGQAKYENWVINGDMEGAADPLWSCFWCHDWRRGVEFNEESGQQYDKGDTELGQFQGFAEIVVDPDDPNNHCAHVYVRSQEEAEAAGNMVADGGNMAGWDSQFFIYVKDSIPVGKQIRLTMKVKADKNDGISAGTQAHCKPGDYNHYVMCGNIAFTDKWEDFEWEGIIDGSQAPAEKGMYSIAINLADYKKGYNAYFDNIKLEVRDQKKPEEFEGWFNFLRKGTLSDDHIQNYTNFTGRDGATGQDVQARLINDPVDGEPALTVTSIGYNAQEVKKEAIVDEEGNPVLDEEGNPTYDISQIDMYIKENGDTLRKQDGSIGIDDWQTQFFVTAPHKFKTGEKYNFVMWARAEKPATIQSQIHRNPGDYLYWEMLGDINLTEEWQKFTFTEKEITSNQNGGYTIAFNCNVLKEVNTYYFRFEEFSANSAEVTDNERVLGSETISLPLGENNKDVSTKVDMTAAVETLEINDLSAFVDNYKMKVKAEEGFSELVQPTTGVFIDANGLFTEAENGIILTVEEETEGNTANFVITNADSGVEPTNTVESKIVFVNDAGWYYLYNLRFISEEAFSNVDDVIKVPTKATGKIVDLTGREVKNPGKGVFIKDGKAIIF